MLVTLKNGTACLMLAFVAGAMVMVASPQSLLIVGLYAYRCYRVEKLPRSAKARGGYSETTWLAVRPET